METLRKITEEYGTIPILGSALKKMMAYARLAGSSEIYGFLLSPEDKNDGIVREAMLARNQHASSASAGLSSEAAAMAKADIENAGRIALGFWHSHGGFSVFHSGTDDHNLDALLGSFVGNTEREYLSVREDLCRFNEKEQSVHYIADRRETIIYVKDLRIVEKRKNVPMNPNLKFVPFFGLTKKGEMLIRDSENTYVIPEVRSVTVHDVQAKAFTTEGIAYSIVVNRAGDSYGEIGYNKWCSTCEREELSINRKVRLNVIPDSEKINEKKLLSDLESSVQGFSRPGEGRHRWMSAIIGNH